MSRPQKRTPEQLKAYKKAWYRRNPEKIRQYGRTYRSKHSWEVRAGSKERARRRKQNLRGKILELFGGCCIRCGFSDPRALQVDHVKGGGLNYTHNGIHYPYRGVFLYRKILLGVFPKKDFQLLCANCNWIKRWENGEALGCPKKYLQPGKPAIKKSGPVKIRTATAGRGV